MAIPEHPNNRKERYLAKIAGQAGATIPAHPHTREEMYLDAIAQGGGGGGGGKLYRHNISLTYITPGDTTETAECTVYRSVSTAITADAFIQMLEAGERPSGISKYEDVNHSGVFGWIEDAAFAYGDKYVNLVDITNITDSVTEV